MAEEQNLYALDGVDVKEGDSFSKFAGELCKSTYGNSRFVQVHDLCRGHFRGPKGYSFHNLPRRAFQDAATDSDGTKSSIITAAGTHFHAGREWVAMTIGDITRWGGIPLVVLDDLSTSSLGKTGTKRNIAFRQMLIGAKQVCDEQSLVLYRGETAELGKLIGGDNFYALTKYLWSGTAIGFINPKTVITGKSLRKGQIVVVLKENGFRCNGISSVRKALAMRFGKKWWLNPEAQEAIRMAASPSLIYDKFLATVNGWYDKGFHPRVQMHLLVHITGGALEGKLGQDILFRMGLSANLHDLYDPPQIMQQCAEWRGMSDKGCYETWNGGQGMLAVVDNIEEAERFIMLAHKFGFEAKIAGEITKEKSPTLVINSKFRGEEIVFRP